MSEQTNSNLTDLNLVLIDNQDSFTYNLVDELRVLGVNLTVYRNTVDTQQVLNALAEYAKQGKTLLMLSPGPGAPSQSGNMPEILKQCEGKYPVLGICLGHQAIVENYQGRVGRAPYVMHGKSSLMHHNCPELFINLASPMAIARYHSLIALDVPDCLRVVAQIDQLPMAVLHQNDRMLGFQFHPESVLTCQGSQLLKQAISFLVSMPSSQASEVGFSASQIATNQKRT
ncbi:aminodeoxychorismate/anthranilate synthase component II [Glaciecola petra]|uniref:anthranilate synthase n=1 Tax=Glaciecola petra TaxID=3075602 RepID=A0ABU2ZQQ4_9ALTE|nr:aminodeoxychorismate/anthranilate synthase component II [Aestuariibacter sp. P117]MDT0594596.1 aminodeoxychorismate/anthranilate synthase component II [Aestuariibacter sp. P117]